MGKRHQASRRRTYGRRQHELHEREGRRHSPAAEDNDLDGFGASSQADPLAFLDPRAPRLRYAIGD